MTSQILDELYAVIEERRQNPSPDSYTSRLFAAGQNEIVKKVGEEAVEVVLAAKDGDHSHTVYEIGDLVYHLLVLMVDSDIRLDEVWDELGRRRR
ncbi:MAG: phosphoribosyl-ATP diphosphatase [Anaerolineae bacterium]